MSGEEREREELIGASGADLDSTILLANYKLGLYLTVNQN